MRISLIIPVYNEEQFIERCLTALMQQTLKLTQIIIVDDGSTDKTLQKISKYKSIQLVRMPVQKESMVERVPYVLAAGSKLLDNFDYLAVLDADTVLEPRYYEKLAAKLEEDKKIGIACGRLEGQAQTGLMLGLIPYVYGCNRLYSKDCWLKINGGQIMKPVPAWDFYHNVYAEMFGFQTKRFDDILSWALRPPGFKKDFIKGYTSYQLGYYGYFLLFRAVRNRSPRLIAGYLKARFLDETEYPIKPYVRYLQTYRMRRLIKKIIP